MLYSTKLHSGLSMSIEKHDFNSLCNANVCTEKRRNNLQNRVQAVV